MNNFLYQLADRFFRSQPVFQRLIAPLFELSDVDETVEWNQPGLMSIVLLIQIRLIIIMFNFPTVLYCSRPHKHPDGTKSTGRVIWELFHKNIGRLGLILALINISLGLLLAVTPVGAWATWFALLGLFIILYVVMEILLFMNKGKSNTVTLPMK